MHAQINVASLNFGQQAYAFFSILQCLQSNDLLNSTVHLVCLSCFNGGGIRKALFAKRGAQALQTSKIPLIFAPTVTTPNLTKM